MALGFVLATNATAQPGGGGPGSGNAGGGEGAPTNWWIHSSEMVLTRNLVVSRGTYEWEGMSVTRASSPETPAIADSDSRSLPWDDGAAAATTGHDDDVSRGELEFHASAPSGLAYARTGCEVNDIWDWGTADLDVTTVAEVSVVSNWTWDGDDLHPPQPTPFSLRAEVDIVLSVSGRVDESYWCPGSALSTAKVSANYQADEPFGYKVKIPEFGISGSATNAPSDLIDWIGVGSGLGVLGVIINLADLEDTDSIRSAYSSSYLLDAVETEEAVVTTGVGYSYKATAFANSATASNGATADAAASARITARLSVGPKPGVGPGGGVE